MGRNARHKPKPTFSPSETSSNRGRWKGWVSMEIDEVHIPFKARPAVIDQNNILFSKRRLSKSSQHASPESKDISPDTLNENGKRGIENASYKVQKTPALTRGNLEKVGLCIFKKNLKKKITVADSTVIDYSPSF